MSLLKKSIKDKDTVAKKAEGAISMFKVALTTLQESSNEAEIIIGENEEKIRLLEEDNGTLTALRDKNKKVIDNISKLIGE